MELRSRTRQQLRRAVFTAALGTLIVPATAGAAAVKTPVITKVTPKNVSVGETLVVNGKNFRRGKAKNTLLFKRDGGKALFVKTGVATKTKIIIAVPKSLEKYMAVKDGKPTATRFRLRVLSTKLGKKFTAVSASPVVGPEKLKGDGRNRHAGARSGRRLRWRRPAQRVRRGRHQDLPVHRRHRRRRRDRRLRVRLGRRPQQRRLPPADGVAAVSPASARTRTRSTRAIVNTDFDGDGLLLWQEYKLWRFARPAGREPGADRAQLLRRPEVLRLRSRRAGPPDSGAARRGLRQGGRLPQLAHRKRLRHDRVAGHDRFARHP